MCNNYNAIITYLIENVAANVKQYIDYSDTELGQTHVTIIISYRVQNVQTFNIDQTIYKRFKSYKYFGI